MKMKKIYTLVFALALTAGLSAQTKIDPTVVVSNNFSGTVNPGAKLPYTPTDPKGVKSFDIKFDYNVFQTSYLGAYDFQPYQIEMHPTFEPEKEKHFYLKAGAGYTLRPEFEFAYSPVLYASKDSTKAKRLSMNIFANHNSFIGAYHVIGENGLKTGLSTKGYDTRSGLGLALTYEAAKYQTTFYAAWRNFSSSIKQAKIDNGLKAYWSISSKEYADQKFEYAVKLSYDLYDDISTNFVGTGLREHDIAASVELGGIFKNRSRLLVGLEAEELYAGALGHTEHFNIHPHYVFTKGRFDLDLGAKIIFLLQNGDHAYASNTNRQFAYPACRAQVQLLKERAILYASVDGENTPGRLGDVLGEYHFLDIANPHYAAEKFVTNEDFPFNAELGLKGDIAQIVDYRVFGYLGSVRKGTLWAPLGGDTAEQMFPLKADAQYMRWGAGCDLAFNYKSFNALAQFSYNGTNILKRYQYLYAPALFRAYGELRYNFSERIYVAISCAFRSGMKIANPAFGTIPHYEDLGFRAEYKTRRGVGFYLKANNLLCQTIQYVPFISEKGVSVVGGIVWTF